MNIPKMAKAMDYIDDDLVTGAIEYKRTKKKNSWMKWGAMAACLCLVIGLAIPTILNNVNSNEGDAGTLMGDTEIYPTVMVDGQLYEWRKGAAICNELPDDCVYYGELIHVEGEKPNNDSEFVSVFSGSGQIYTISENDKCVYLCLTTDWLNETFVVFDLVEDDNAQDYVETITYNGAEYAVCGTGEVSILENCGLTTEITKDLAGEHLGYLEQAEKNAYHISESATDGDVELFEYAPQPNDNVYILCIDGKYYAAICRDSEGYHGLTDIQPTE